MYAVGGAKKRVALSGFFCTEEPNIWSKDSSGVGGIGSAPHESSYFW
jgi:hypothetical protein